MGSELDDRSNGHRRVRVVTAGVAVAAVAGAATVAGYAASDERGRRDLDHRVANRQPGVDTSRRLRTRRVPQSRRRRHRRGRSSRGHGAARRPAGAATGCHLLGLLT